MRFALISAILALLGTPAVLADSLDARLPSGGFRDVAWQDPFPGKWKTVDVTQKGVLPDAPDVTAALQALVDGLAEPTILSFPPGVYHFGKITIKKSNVILKGAGPKKTTFRPAKDGMLFCWWGTGGWYDWPRLGPEFQPRPITTDVPPPPYPPAGGGAGGGGTVVPIADTAGLKPGDMVLVVEDLDRWSYDDAKRGRGGMFLISKVEKDRITLDLPLALGLEQVGKKNAFVAKIDPVRNVGLEGVRIEMPEARGEKTSTLFLKRALNGYVRNVESFNPSRHHLEICYSRQVVVDGCLFDEAKDKGPGGYGYGANIRDLSTLCKVENNIFKDVRHALATEVGANYCIYAYNLTVDRVRDLAHSPNAPAECRDEKWINSKERNGISSAFITADLVAHGNFPHNILVEGNVFYNGCVDISHVGNGPHFFFRNCALGQPPRYAWWQEGAGIVIMGANDNQVVVGNLLRNGSTILLQKHTDPRASENSLIAGNVVKGAVDWGPLPAGTKLPPSLYLKARPAWWPAGLPWPAFGPDARNGKIPAQLRYEGM